MMTCRIEGMCFWSFCIAWHESQGQNDLPLCLKVFPRAALVLLESDGELQC